MSIPAGPMVIVALLSKAILIKNALSINVTSSLMGPLPAVTTMNAVSTTKPAAMSILDVPPLQALAAVKTLYWRRFLQVNDPVLLTL